MTHDELIRKIKNIKKIEPSQSWIFSNKKFIFNYIQAKENKEARKSVLKPSISALNFTEKISLFFRGFGAKFLLPAISVLAIVFLTGSFVLAKAQAALPGDALYSVKIFAEKIEVAMTFNEEQRATLNFDLADKRLSEISSLAENAGGKNVSGSDVDVAMQNFNNHLSAAVNGMDNVVKSDATSSKAATVAKIANNKTSDYVKKIAKAKDVIDSKSNSSVIVKDQMAQTIKKIEEVNFDALTVLASLEKNNADQAISKEVSEKVGEKINEAMAKTDTLKQKISIIEETSADEKNIKLASDLVAKAGSNLEEAKKYLINKDSSKALEKIIASNEMTNTAEKITTAGVFTAGDASVIMPSVGPTVSPKTSATPTIPSIIPEPNPTPSISPVAPSISPTPSTSPAPAVKNKVFPTP